jgi:saccharopine dehydrogenase-like NADP-dependent oxidoreductase
MMKGHGNKAQYLSLDVADSAALDSAVQAHDVVIRFGKWVGFFFEI